MCFDWLTYKRTLANATDFITFLADWGYNNKRICGGDGGHDITPSLSSTIRHRFSISVGHSDLYVWPLIFLPEPGAVSICWSKSSPMRTTLEEAIVGRQMIFGPHCHDFTVFRLDMCSECFVFFACAFDPFNKESLTYLLTYLVGTQTPQLPKATVSSSQVRSKQQQQQPHQSSRYTRPTASSQRHVWCVGFRTGYRWSLTVAEFKDSHSQPPPPPAVNGVCRD